MRLWLSRIHFKCTEVFPFVCSSRTVSLKRIRKTLFWTSCKYSIKSSVTYKNRKTRSDWLTHSALSQRSFIQYRNTLVRRSKGPCDNRTDHPLAPKPTVLMRNDINSFCRYPNYNQKLLIRFFTKSLRFLAKPEKPVFMPRPVSKASHQVPTLIRKKAEFGMTFYMKNIS